MREGHYLAEMNKVLVPICDIGRKPSTHSMGNLFRKTSPLMLYDPGLSYKSY